MSSASSCKPTNLPSGLKEVLKDPSGLQVRVYYLECLAHASYIVEHDGKAVVIDPRRDVDAYIDELTNLRAELKGILETHVHADFVSGHLELQKHCNVPIYFGPGAASRAKFSLHELHDGEEVPLSTRYVFRVLHTPGHTPESICYLLVDKEQNNKPLKIFTGDTLFIGSCGRPDLVGSLGHTSQDMAGMMFDSLQNKLMTLPLEVQVFPAHGAGSPCGKNLSTALYSTIGKELDTNPALKFSEKAKFVTFLTADPSEVPQYFLYVVASNLEGAQPLSEDVLKVSKVSPLDFMKRSLQDKQFVILDTRKASDFAGAFIPKSINCPIGSEGGVIVGLEDGNFSIWVGTMIPKTAKIGLVTPPEREWEAFKRLGRIGYVNVDCVLSGGIEEWQLAGYATHSFTKVNLEAHPQMMHSLTQCGYQLVDVRTDFEYKSNTVQGAISMPLPKLQQMMCQLDRAKPVVCFCNGGFRSSIATSLLLREGYSAQDVLLGFTAISTYSPELTTRGQRQSQSSVSPSMKEVVAE